ncbi:MAG: translation initiation factor IF-6 [Asgard group archaeon]
MISLSKEVLHEKNSQQIVRINYKGSECIGVFFLASESYALIPRGSHESLKEIVEETLQVPVIETTAGESSVVGVLVHANSYGILLPHIASDEEVSFLQHELGLKVAIVPTRYTALGNVVLGNDYATIVHPKMEKEAVKVIEETLETPVYKAIIGGSPLVGAYAVATNKGILCHVNSSLSEVRWLTQTLKVEDGGVTTINRGIPYVKIGLVANSGGALCGKTTTGPELMRIKNVLF